MRGTSGAISSPAPLAALRFRETNLGGKRLSNFVIYITLVGTQPGRVQKILATALPNASSPIIYPAVGFVFSELVFTVLPKKKTRQKNSWVSSGSGNLPSE
jgi:hypothetical protein